MFGIDAILGIGGKLIDKLIPDEAQRAKAQLDLATLAQNGELKELETRMSAILAEANSKDPWTSRARPSFMYVFYILLLASIPMGVLFAISPETAAQVTEGFKGWLAAIPDAMWNLFMAGYLGYSASRSFDKHSLNKRTK